MIKLLKINSNKLDYSIRDAEIIDYLNELQKNKNQPLKILDVGGGSNIRLPNTTHVLDFLPPRENYNHTKNIKFFTGDIDLYDGWQEVFEFVKQNGKFDFVVCSHTLEDINNPLQAILNICKIGNSGMIAVPSKYIETYRWENHYSAGNYIGYCHHRWIYTIKNGILYGYPKMNSMEYVKFNFFSQNKYIKNFPNGHQTEMTFLWENNIPIKFTPPYQYYNHFEFTENNRSTIIDLLEKDDVCEYIDKKYEN